MKFTSKQMFNATLHEHYPELGEYCQHEVIIPDGFLVKNIDLFKMSRVTKYDIRLTDIIIGRMSDESYYAFLNDMYNHIQNNEDMIEFWLL